METAQDILGYNEMFLSRTEYDHLIMKFPEIMRDDNGCWRTLSRQWSMGGVWVKGSVGEIELLRMMLVCE